MNKYLILVKHSVPEMQVDHLANTWSLSEEGRSRAQKLAEYLADYEPEVIVSSNEPKAKETAEIVASQFHLNVQIIPDLHEHDRSNLPFLSLETFQALIRDFFQKPNQLVFGTETADQTYSRFYRAVHSVLNEHRDKTVVVVAHGTVISLFISRLTGSSGLELWKTLGLPSFVAMDLNSNTVIVKNTVV